MQYTNVWPGKMDIYICIYIYILTVKEHLDSINNRTISIDCARIAISIQFGVVVLVTEYPYALEVS